MKSLFPTRTKAAALRSPLLQLCVIPSRSGQRPRLFPTARNAPTIVSLASVVQKRWLHAKENKSAEPNKSRKPDKPEEIDKPAKVQIPGVPEPTPFVPDVKTFLTLIGRDLHKHVEKFPSWEALFTLNSEQLQELGIEPPRTRKYLIQWRHRFYNGIFGVGGDVKFVENGKAELRVLELPGTPAGVPPIRVVVNVPRGKQPKKLGRDDMARVRGFKVRKANIITGPYAIPLRQDLGGGAYIEVKEGMWEHRRGHKVDGGERRRTETRFLKRVAERRAKREERMANK